MPASAAATCACTTNPASACPAAAMRRWTGFTDHVRPPPRLLCLLLPAETCCGGVCLLWCRLRSAASPLYLPLLPARPVANSRGWQQFLPCPPPLPSLAVLQHLLHYYVTAATALHVWLILSTLAANGDA